jgi:hypothetical protein
MIPNRQNPAYSLFARRPIVHSRGMSSLRIHLPAWKRSRRPVAKTLPTECRFPRAGGSKSEGNISTAHGGCGPQILSAFVKQRTYQPLPIRNSTHRTTLVVPLVAIRASPGL